MASRTRACLAGLTALLLGSCDLLASFPLIRPNAVTFGSATAIKTLTASITQRGDRLAPGALTVACAVSLRQTPSRSTPLAEIIALQRGGTSWACIIPPGADAMFRPNHVIQVQWLVRSGTQNVADSGVSETLLDCPSPVPTLTAEQGRVLSRFLPIASFEQIIDGRNVLLSAGEVLPLTRDRWVPTHGATSFDGMGVAFIRSRNAVSQATVPSEFLFRSLSGPQFGTPDLLLYAPNGTGPGVEDPVFPDNNYRLIGWAYAQTIAGAGRAKPTPGNGAPMPGPLGIALPPQPRPVLPCVPHHEWMLHTSGFHELNGQFTPAASRLRLGPPAMAFHGDLWDLHFFSGPGGLPRFGIKQPAGLGPAVPGIAAPDNAFYHPTGYD